MSGAKNQTKMKTDLNYLKKNAEEDYMQVPISVLRYITELERVVFPQADVIKSVCLHDWDEGFNNISKCKKCGKYSA